MFRRWIFDPFEEIRRMQERFGRLLDEFERSTRRFAGVGPMEFPVDVIEEEDKVRILADLPGFKKEDIEIYFEDGSIVIRAKRKEEIEKREKGYIRQERRYGEVFRRLPIPVEVELEKAKANYSNGVLEVVLPKVEKTKRKVIKIE